MLAVLYLLEHYNWTIMLYKFLHVGICSMLYFCNVMYYMIYCRKHKKLIYFQGPHFLIKCKSLIPEWLFTKIYDTFCMAAYQHDLIQLAFWWKFLQIFIMQSAQIVQTLFAFVLSIFPSSLFFRSPNAIEKFWSNLF